MNRDRLVEIPIVDLPKLRDIYKDYKHEPNSYNTIQNYIIWFQKDPALDFAKIYSLNGDWSDGTFVIRESKATVQCNTLNPSNGRLLAALNCLDKTVTYAFAGINERIFPEVEKYFKQMGGEHGPPLTTIWQHISTELALKFDTEPPDGINVSSVRLEYAHMINNLWPHRFPGSDVFISRLISTNLTVGAYDKEDNLVAWILQVPTGGFGTLHVIDEYKRKGLGSLMVRVLAKKFVQNGFEPIAPVVDVNIPSRNMFEKLNFKEVGKVYWWTMSPRKLN